MGRDHKVLKSWILTTLLIIASITLLTGCGEYTASGIATNAASGIGIPDVTILATGDTYALTKTSWDGSWTLEGLKGKVRIEAKKDGWTFRSSLIIEGQCWSEFIGDQVY